MVLTSLDMINLETIQCHLTLNLLFTRLRQEKLLITAEK